MNYYEPNLCYESNYSGFDHFQPPQYSVIHQPPHEKTIGELLAEERAANIDQSPPQEISIQDMEDLKQHYLDEMKSLINDLQIKDYRNERIDIQYRREYKIKIDELKQNFNGMSIEIRKKEKELMQQEQAACVRTSQRLEEVKDFDPEDGEIDTDILLTIKDDILREKLLNINLLIAKIEALNANQTPSSDFVLKSPIPVEDGDSFLEKFETTPELETFKFDIEEKNSGSTTIHADISLSDLECFYFKSEPDPGDLTSIIDPGIRENVSSTTNVNLPFKDDQSPLFAYVV
ncbi:hypothetical protein Tco_0054422 [Tanacetum coccineum]